jgi:hypothetical protein
MANRLALFGPPRLFGRPRSSGWLDPGGWFWRWYLRCWFGLDGWFG